MSDVRREWRPRLWVRCVAVMVPVLLASTLLYPQVLNPDWASGTPSDELPWLAAVIVVSAAAAYAALISRIVVDPPNVRIVNPWGARTLQTADIVAVVPGRFGVEFVSEGGRRYVAFAVQCTAGPPRWADVAKSVTGHYPLASPELSAVVADLAAQVEQHGRLRGYQVTPLGPARDGYVVFKVSVPAREEDVTLSLNGETFLLNLPGGYTWAEFSESPDDGPEVLADQLAMIDAYADPRTSEVTVPRRFGRGLRKELHLSNGAVLRRHGWSRGPTHIQD
jgi:hypothetical protein